MSKKTVFDDINSSNKFELSINESFNSLFIKIKVDENGDDEDVKSAWMTIDYRDLDGLIEAIAGYKKKIEDNI
ncbi:hypothetical protein SAMN05443634_10382 [Chishuiella changwenlii]|uniref:Uncharacterized protein n=1 Tax=Chishuiella changwenlii TaxID=1434701 RepID=A0A1M6UVK1_9FLAO|nr:hypothetical protein [Chishuiella changwenlii]GGF07847.1 hypothetical protein GCM10010984_26260 [Chishuiella changwenlii]SHK73262.1 hypothetical protein SAMN05443634_10382 [Chishuiella changwenlii]